MSRPLPCPLLRPRPHRIPGAPGRPTAAGCAAAGGCGCRGPSTTADRPQPRVARGRCAASAAAAGRLGAVRGVGQQPVALGVDPASVTLGPDGVIRYVIVAQSASGALNAWYEGLRCTTAQVKTYAHWNPGPPGNGAPTPGAEWRNLGGESASRSGGGAGAQRLLRRPHPPTGGRPTCCAPCASASPSADGTPGGDRRRRISAGDHQAGRYSSSAA